MIATVREVAAFLSALPESEQDKQFGITYDSDMCVAWASREMHNARSGAQYYEDAFVLAELGS